jgi:hypothetical protein
MIAGAVGRDEPRGRALRVLRDRVLLDAASAGHLAAAPRVREAIVAVMREQHERAATRRAAPCRGDGGPACVPSCPAGARDAARGGSRSRRAVAGAALTAPGFDGWARMVAAAVVVGRWAAHREPEDGPS